MVGVTKYCKLQYKMLRGFANGAADHPKPPLIQFRQNPYSQRLFGKKTLKARNTPDSPYTIFSTIGNGPICTCNMFIVKSRTRANFHVFLCVGPIASKP